MDPRLPFERFAVCPRFETQLAELVALAQKENWDYRLTKSALPFPVLRSFILYTFARLEAEGKIAEAVGKKDERVVCFNTGLATARQEAIYAVFNQNRDTAPNAPPWVLDRFAKERDRALTCFAQRPSQAPFLVGTLRGS